MVPKHHNNAFILLLTNSGQSQLHFGNKYILVGANAAKLRSNSADESRKLIFFTKGPRKVLKVNIYIYK